MISQNGILTDKNCANYFDVWNWHETTVFIDILHNKRQVKEKGDHKCCKSAFG